MAPGTVATLRPTTPESVGPAMFSPGSMLWQVPQRRWERAFSSTGGWAWAGAAIARARKSTVTESEPASYVRIGPPTDSKDRGARAKERSHVTDARSGCTGGAEHRGPPSRGAAAPPRGGLRLRRWWGGCGEHPS